MWKKIADGTTLLPEFSLSNMMAYFVTRKVCDGQNAGDFKHLNNHSYPLFKSGHIQKILAIKGNDNNVYLNAVCLPEMRKDREYKIQMVLSPSAEILYAEDGCPAGRGPTGSCKHIAALCYALEEFVRLGFTRPLLSCTSRLQTWNQPRQKKLASKNIYEISFERAEYGKVKKAHPKPFPLNYNAIPVKHRREQLDATLKLANLSKGLSNPCAFVKVLNTGQRGATSVQQVASTVPTNLDSHPVNQASCPIPAISFLPPSNPESSMQTTPAFTVHNSTISTSPVTLGKSPIGVHFSSTVSSGETQPEVVPIESPVIMGNKGLNLRRTLNEIPATPSPTPPVSSAHSTPPMKGNIISSPYPLPSQTVQATPSHFPSSPLPLTPPNYSPPCSTFGTGASLSTSMDMPVKLPLHDSSVNEVSVPKNLSEEAKLLLNSTVKVNFDQAAAIESSTREQSESIDWFKYRQCRLTASNFGAVLKRRKKDCSKLVERLTSSHGNLNVSSLHYGRDNEDIVADYYLQYQERHGHRGIKVFPCGLIVNPKYSWLGASPDRIVYDPTSDTPYGGLEIKCIESGKGMTPLQTYEAKREPQFGKKKSFCLIKNGDILQLDQKHHYHHQVQGQCGVSGLRWNDFMLMTDLNLGDQGVHVERIYFDKTWHGTSLPKLTDFYFNHIMPALLQKS